MRNQAASDREQTESLRNDMLPYLVCPWVWCQGQSGSLVIWGLACVQETPLKASVKEKRMGNTPAFG